MSRILLGVTGSVAAVKTPELVALLRSAGHAVKIVPTRAALVFFDAAALEDAAPPEDPLRVRGQGTLYLDSDEWPQGRRFRVGEPVLHIELRKWAELLLVAPLDAHTLAKFALGLCDNLLTCVYRAWDFARPVVLAPAMNTRMWEHPATTRHLLQLLEDSTGRPAPPLSSPGPEAACAAIAMADGPLAVVPPQEKQLACGDVGTGAMADLAEILRAADHLLGKRAMG